MRGRGFGIGGKGGDSARGLIVVDFASASESLDEESESELAAVTFFGPDPSDSVALVSELTAVFFFLSLSDEESLSESEDESESEAGSGVFLARDVVDESESEPEVEEESSEESSEDSSTGLFKLTTAGFGASVSSSLEEESVSEEDDFAATLVFLARGASSSEDESDDDEELLEDCFRLRFFGFDFGEAALVAETSFSSSASLSELLDESDEDDPDEDDPEDDPEAAFLLAIFFTTGASFISTSLSSLSLLELAELLELLPLLLVVSSFEICSCFAVFPFLFNIFSRFVAASSSSSLLVISSNRRSSHSLRQSL